MHGARCGIKCGRLTIRNLRPTKAAAALKARQQQQTTASRTTYIERATVAGYILVQQPMVDWSTPCCWIWQQGGSSRGSRGSRRGSIGNNNSKQQSFQLVWSHTTSINNRSKYFGNKKIPATTTITTNHQPAKQWQQATVMNHCSVGYSNLRLLIGITPISGNPIIMNAVSISFCI